MEELALADSGPSKGAEPRRLLDVLNALCREVGHDSRGADSPAPLAEESPPGAVLSAEDEQLVAGLRAGLSKLAAGRRTDDTRAPAAVRGALDGAEFVARSEILNGQRRRLPQLLPSFAFLVVLPLLGRAEALRVSRRADALLVGSDQIG